MSVIQRPSELTDAELELRIQQNPPDSIRHKECAAERTRRQLDRLGKPHWTFVPLFWIGLIAAIAAVTSAALLLWDRWGPVPH